MRRLSCERVDAASFLGEEGVGSTSLLRRFRTTGGDVGGESTERDVFEDQTLEKEKKPELFLLEGVVAVGDDGDRSYGSISKGEGRCRAEVRRC
jgi:hypothetical protein